MDREACLVDGALARQNVAVMIDQHQIGHADMTKPGPERRNPEAIGKLGISGCDMACQAVIEPFQREDTVGGCEPAFAMRSFVLEGGTRRLASQCEGRGAGNLAHSHLPWISISGGRIDNVA